MKSKVKVHSARETTAHGLHDISVQYNELPPMT